VIFKQFYLPCLAHASYMIGDEDTGTATVVDPQRDTDQYIAFAAEHALKIKHVFLTHLHADFIAGHLGEQRRTNYALQPMSKETFISVVTADQPDAPAYFTYDAVLNSQERPTLDETLARVNAMTLDDVLALQAVGAQILDTRNSDEFGAAHLAGSIKASADSTLHGLEPSWIETIQS
jgi:glyoxylase-like metal-dependent hydrolase (beta-lactamase superfamily II)